MNMRTTMLRPIIVLALVAGMVAAMVGLFGFNGPSPVSAQADTTAPAISYIAFTSDPDIRYDGTHAGVWGPDWRWPLGLYGIGDEIQVKVRFSEDVVVTGTPQIYLTIGNNSRAAVYESTDGYSVHFSYTVIEGDSDTDGISISHNSLDLMGGSIQDEAGNDANLFHRHASPWDIQKVDGIRPTLNGLEVVSLWTRDGNADILTGGERLYVVPTFSETVYGSASYSPLLTLDLDGETKVAEWKISDIPDRQTSFIYTIQEGDLDDDGVSIDANSINLNGGFIKDGAGNDAILTHQAVESEFQVDAVPPTVSSIAITSDPGEDDTYQRGDLIEVTVTFSEDVEVRNRRILVNGLIRRTLPQLKLDIGGEVRTANYLRANGKEAVFYYTVQDGDTDSNGIAISPVQTFRNAWGSSPYAVFIDRGAYFVDDARNGATISYDALDDEMGHQVDGLSSALTVSGDTTVRYRENRDDSVGDYAVSGSDGDITWSLSGDDADNFSVNGNSEGTGELSFKSAPSYEDPSDADGDNYYRVTIAASDGTSTGSLQVVVVVARSNQKAVGVPMIGGIAKVGHQLTVDTSGITDDDGMTNAYFTYEWLADDSYLIYISGDYPHGFYSTHYVRGPTHTVRSRDVGKTIRVRVSFTDDAGNKEMLTSEATGTVVPNRPPAPWSLSRLSSVTEDNDVLLGWVGLSFTDETVNGHRIYRHRPDEGETEPVVLLENTNSSMSEWTDDDAAFGTRYIYHVAAISPTGVSELSEPYEVTVGIPAVVGTPKNGQELSADTSGIWKPAWPRNGTYSFRHQWLANGAVLNNANQVTYTLSAEDIGKTIRVRVSFSDNDGNEITLTSAATPAVAPRPNIPATGVPGIYGRVEVDQRLRADTTGIEDENGMTGVEVWGWDWENFSQTYVWAGHYQWIRSDGTTDTDIPGATDSSYVLVADDVGQNIKLRVSFTDDEGYEETLTSSATDAVSPRPNSPATGSVRISNHAREGQTLTAWTSSISDADGLSGSSFSYQWIRNDGTADSEISGATGSEYTLVSEDVGKTVKARVSFTDDSGTEESLVSIGTHPVVRALNSGEWSPLNYVTVVIGRSDLDPDRVITNFNVTWNDTFDCSPGYNAYLISTNIRYSGETPNSREILHLGSAGSDGTQVSGELTSIATDTDIDFADVELYCGTEEAGRLVSMTRVGLYHPTEYPVIPGDREPTTADRILVGSYSSQSRLSQLTFSHGTLTPLLKNHTFGYSLPSFEYSVPDVPKTVQRITITATPDTGYAVEFFEGTNGPILVTGIYSVGPDGIVPSECDYMNVDLDHLIDADPDMPGFQADLEEGDNLLIVQVYPTSPCTTGFFYLFTVTRTGNSLPTGVPTISGTAQVGEMLTADITGIADADGLTNVSYNYQWLADDTVIAGATGNTYVLTSTELGKAVEVRVTFTDDGGNDETLTSEATAAVSAALPPPPDNVRAVPQKSGAVELTWDAPPDATVTGYRIDRRRSDESRSEARTLVEDTGSPETGYTDESAEKGVEYEYQVSARNEAGPGEASGWVRAGPDLASNNPATGAPTIRGTARVGQTLTADITGISDADGLIGETFTYQWVSSDGTTDTDIEKATGSTYKLVAADQGKSVKVRVTFTDGGGNEEALTSAASGAVLEEPVFGDGPPGAPGNLTITAGDQELTLSWEPPDDNGNPPATRYRIEWRIDGKDYKKGHWGTSGSTTYTKTDLANGVKYFFRVKAENGNGNSYGPYGPASEEVSATPTSGSAVDLGTPVLSNTKTLHHGMVQLDWEDIEGAGWYVVQYYHVKSGEWLDLPAAGVDIAFHGSSAVVSNLHGLSWLRVRAMSCAGESEWSQIEELYGTKGSDWEDVPVPEVAEGDEIEPCPVILGTPVLSGPETLHHGMVRLDWQDIEDAGWHVVQYYHVKSGEWLDLPAEGVDIAFHGSSAVVSNLHGLSWLRVRAVSCAGESEWSQIEELYGTKASDWEGVPVPEVAEGDQIEPCSEDADTPANSPATGAPAISGTAQVGETLTAGTSGIADEDGLENVSFSYQWTSGGEDIAGATGATYTLVEADKDKTVTVQVSFTDDEGNEETLTSAATDAVAAAPASNSPATGVPTISGTAQVGETLTADTSGIADADGLTSVTYSYQWLADDAEITGATGSTYALVAEDEGKAIKVQVSFTDDEGNKEMLTSAATGAVLASTQVDSEDESSLRSYITVVVAEDTSDPDNPQTDFTITWSDTDTCSTNYNAYLNIEPGNRPGHETPGSQLDLGSTASDGALITKSLSGVQGSHEGFYVELYCGTYGSGRLVSRVEIPMAYTRPMPETYSTEPPLSALSVSHGTLTPAFNSHTSHYAVPDVADADTRITITVIPKTGYAVDLLESSGGPVTEFATHSYTPAGPPSGLSSDCERSHSDAWGQLIELTDADPDTPGFQVDLYDGENHVYVSVYPTAHCTLDTRYTLAITRAEGSVSLPRPNRPAIGAPTISGAPLVGRTLNTNTSEIKDRDGLSNATFSYQWLSDDGEITGATSSSYTVETADIGKTLKVRVSFTDERGNEETLTSPATKEVEQLNLEPTGKPIILGTPEVGQTLSADISDISDRNGMTNATFSYQWVANDGTSDTDIPGARDSTYPLVAANEGKVIKVRVSFTDDAGNEERLTSAATAAVAAQPTEPPAKPMGLSATASHDSVTLTWNEPGDDSITGYVILRRVRVNDTGGDFSELVADTGSAATTYTDDTVAASTTYTYRIKAINEHGVSERSRWFHIDTPAAPEPDNSAATGAPTISGTAQVGETLTANTSGIADENGLSNVQYEYQWLADDADISGATNATYTLVAADEGKAIKVEVSFTDDAGNAETLTSAATDAVAAAEPAEPPAKPRGLSATATYDQVILTWDDPQDDSITGYVILRRVRVNDTGGDFSELVADTGSAATTYTDDTVAASTTYTYRIKAINEHGVSERSRWFHIDTPAAL